MNSKILATVIVLATTSFITPVKSQEPVTQTPATSNEVVNACVQNQAETLPNPFTDVPSDHWAFKAVMTMHYCGAFRQATPPALFEKFQPNNRQQQPQPEQRFEK
ncbi:MAG: S-layer protein [Nostoc sp. GBBB01]|uniref:S-layer protein n=1 Tax=Nostoc punctiforme FACHB-252 TaxID=1357509 RepID=A0ABR8H938_NOSPU|nr:S-layer protein [Nostoc punctiforme]MBD2612362.1 S-layer protein [Nostoc punctiforme FACHB-252]MBL1198802.1 S-layer protein [Nostoc sp. GBBB01]